MESLNTIIDGLKILSSNSNPVGYQDIAGREEVGYYTFEWSKDEQGRDVVKRFQTNIQRFAEFRDNLEKRNLSKFANTDVLSLLKFKSEIINKLSESISAKKDSFEIRKNMIFYGPPGTGKTTLAMSIALAYHSGFKKVYASRWSALLDRFRSKNSEGEFEGRIHDIGNYDLIILDEVASSTRSKASYFEADLLLELLSLSESSSMKWIITTNKDETELREIYDGSVASRLFSRSNNFVLDFSGETNFR